MKKNHRIMKSNKLRLVLCFVAILAFGIADLADADAGCCLASASGTGIKAKTSVVNTALGKSSIGCNGGNKTDSLATASIPGLLSAGVVETSASGTTTQTSSHARVDDVLVTAGANIITATQLISDSQSSCSGNATGSSTIQNLSINGQSVNITGEPNQVVPIPGGIITINAQSGKSSGCVKNISVTALKISMLGVADVTLAASQAGVACVTFSCQ
jgi:hypothetical protein